LIVNTASKCGYTYQYKGLQKLHETYGDSVEILGFPANNFLWQEPGNEEQIASFCEVNFGVSFQMFSKVSVVGRNKHQIYQWLEAKSGKIPSWNFCKYVINERGEFVAFFPATVEPMDKKILELL
jgi:glutathione peroxidase